MHIVLPDDQWADLVDPKKVSERKRRPVMRAMAALSLHQTELAAGDQGSISEEMLDEIERMNESVILALVKEWSFGEVTVDAVRDLPGDAFDVLRDACSKLTTGLMPSFQVDPDPKEALTTGSSPT